MTDLEITKLCAEAMGLHWVQSTDGLGNGYIYISEAGKDSQSLVQWRYDPLHDDAQAMALVKKFGLDLSEHDGRWQVYEPDSAAPDSEDVAYSYSTDLNRAICECVAKMQKAKT